MIMDDEGIKELLVKAEKTGSVVKFGERGPATFAGLPGQLLKEEDSEEGYLIKQNKNKRRKFFPIASEDVPYLRSHDPFGVIEQQVESSSVKPEQSNGGNHYTSGRRRHSFEAKADSEDFEDKEEMDISEIIRYLADHLEAVSTSNSKAVGSVLSATQQELRLQELRVKADNEHALLCHEFTPYFANKRKEMEVPVGTRNGILGTLDRLAEDSSQADRIRKDMGVTRYIGEVFRLKECSLGTPTLPEAADSLT